METTGFIKFPSVSDRSLYKSLMSPLIEINNRIMSPPSDTSLIY